ncbi:uncharacterized mitochondrial protein AtMg00810-like, partial [Dioscorea cayenensis subsp. rotundata]|uniref:Uncharacterized mitochondrial protein AtMg00810-like n=1 Tax=Dioscorea cayennensis subsp. rotundata TaxID=55577 RepID=A0AB40AXZ3_DIOCR
MRSLNEPTVYKRDKGGSNILMLCVCVDDIIYMSSSSEMMTEFRENMMSTFEISDLGPLRYLLGLEDKQKPGSLFVSQLRYAEDLLKKTGMLHSKPIASPMNSNKKLSLKDISGNADPTRYRKIIGGLLYLTHTRPDLAFAVGVVSRFMQAPTTHHLGAVKRILHYVAGTVSYGLHFSHNNNFKLIGYTDSDWGGSPDDRKSTSGWVISLGSAAIAWSSKKQLITALSSTEAEYISVTSAACEAVRLRRLLEELNEKQE